MNKNSQKVKSMLVGVVISNSVVADMQLQNLDCGDRSFQSSSLLFSLQSILGAEQIFCSESQLKAREYAVRDNRYLRNEENDTSFRRSFSSSTQFESWKSQGVTVESQRNISVSSPSRSGVKSLKGYKTLGNDT